MSRTWKDRRRRGKPAGTPGPERSEPERQLGADVYVDLGRPRRGSTPPESGNEKKAQVEAPQPQGQPGYGTCCPLDPFLGGYCLDAIMAKTKPELFDARKRDPWGAQVLPRADRIPPGDSQ